MSPDVYRVVALARPDVTRDWPYEAAAHDAYSTYHLLPTPIEKYQHHSHYHHHLATKLEARESKRTDISAIGSLALFPLFLSLLYALFLSYELSYDICFSLPSHLSQVRWLTVWLIHCLRLLSVTVTLMITPTGLSKDLWTHCDREIEFFNIF